MNRMARPLPGINRDTRFFWDGLRKGQLLIQRCSECHTLRHPPGPVCIKCHSFKWDTLQASGRGILHSFVKVYHPELPCFDSPNPVGLIELVEGTRLVGGLEGFSQWELKIGAPVQAVIEMFDNGEYLVLFRPEG